MNHLAVEAMLGSREVKRFKAIVQRRDDRRGDRSLQLLSLSSRGYLYHRTIENDRQQASESNLSRCLAVEQDDLVVNPMWITGGSLAVSRLNGAVSPDYRVFRIRSSEDPRFIHHLLRSNAYLDQYRLYARAETTFDRRIQQADLDELPIPAVPLAQQRRIADFLDDQVARIDNIVAAREKQRELATQLRWQNFVERVLATGVERAQIRRAIASVADGPFGSAFSSSDYAESGPAVIRLGNIGFGEFRDHDLARIPVQIYERFPRCHVNPGELLIAGLGDPRNHPGRACVAPSGLGAAMVKGKCFRAVPRRFVGDAEYLAILLSSDLGAEAFDRSSRGATRAMINIDILLSAELPLPSLAVQQELVRGFAGDSVETGRVVDLLGDQVSRVLELKRSLITAAVTGEFDVSAADGSRVLV